MLTTRFETIWVSRIER